MFSHRTPVNLTPNRLARALSDARRSGRLLVDLTESNPTRVALPYPADYLAPLGNARALTYAPCPLGTPAARQAVAADYARRGFSVPEDRIVLTASTSDAYSMLFKLVADPGDEVLVPRPSYPLFDHLACLDCVAARSYDLEYDGHWTIDFESIERALTPRTRAILVVSPNNPTGSVVKAGELDRLARTCLARDLTLVQDEVFADYPLDADRAPSVATRRDVLTFALGGLSKSVGLPQAKLGWIGVGGPDAVVDSAIERLGVICDTYLSVSTPVQEAAAELLSRGAVVRQAIHARVAANYRQLRGLALAWPACRVLRVEGGWYAVVQVPSYRSEEELVIELLDIDGVLVHPGYLFDFPRESFVVVSLLVPEDAFAIGVRQLLARASVAPP